MMEHVGPKNHRHVMEVVHRCLVDDGIALIHTIANNRSRRHGTPFIEKYIFPNAVAPSHGAARAAIEGLFVLEDLHNIGPDYDPTLMAWWENFDRTYPELQPSTTGASTGCGSSTCSPRRARRGRATASSTSWC